jgi:hypothetical protein
MIHEKERLPILPELTLVSREQLLLEEQHGRHGK